VRRHRKIGFLPPEWDCKARARKRKSREILPTHHENEPKFEIPIECVYWQEGSVIAFRMSRKALIYH